MEESEILNHQIEELKASLQSKDKNHVNQIIDSIHPIDLAIEVESFSDEEILALCALITNEKIANLLEEADDELQVRMILLMDNYRALYLFNYMSKDDIVDILGNLPLNKRKEIINLMKVGDRKVIQQLLGYAEDTAGGLMTTEYIALNSQLTIKETINKIKEIGPKTEIIEIIFVLNERKQLIGTVDLRDILTSPNQEILYSIIDENVISVEPETDQEEVSLLVSKYNLKVIPVVNNKNALLGIITVDDILDVMVEEHTEDMLHLGGVSKEESIDSNLGESVKLRLPWLFVNLLTAFLASSTVGLFEDTIAQVVALAAAMPIVAGMGGNAGTQTLSIMIRSITLGEIQLKGSGKLLLKEILLGIINGAATGLVTGLILYWKYGNPYLGIIIFISMIGNLVIAGFFGFLIPLILKACKADPALASAIFLTTATDVFGFFIFLGLAQMFLPVLI